MGSNNNVSTKLEWYEAIAALIEDDVESFYEKFYPSSTIKRSGKSYSLEPCPMCGHKNCCKIGSNMLNCLSASCHWSGTHINAWCDYAQNASGMSYNEAIKALADHFGIPFLESSPEETERQNLLRRQQEILKAAEKFYYDKLVNCISNYKYKEFSITPLAYLINIRKRRRDTIDTFKIGFSLDYVELRALLLSGGYSEEEIEEAKVRVPEGLFTFFYHHPTTKDIVRINTKNPFNSRYKFYNDRREETEGDVIAGWSSSSIKSFYYTPKFSFKKPILLVEGEHDLYSAYENGGDNTLCLGGQVSDETYAILEKCEAEIYTAFDNDDAGEAYLSVINRLFPEKIIKRLQFGENYNDVDEYYCNDDNPKSIASLISDAQDVATDGYKVHHRDNIWDIQDRTKRIEFIIKSRTEKGILCGQANLYNAAGKLMKRHDDINLSKCSGTGFQPFAYYLSDAIESFFNSSLDKRSFEELAKLYEYSSRKNEIVKLLAKHMSESDNLEGEILKLKLLIKDVPNYEKVIDLVLIEHTNIANADFIAERKSIPKIKVSQYYNTYNGDAYFYYTCEQRDISETRYVPYLLKNDGTRIRLDLYKRKDPQCLLLIENKYELPCEIPAAIFDVKNCSLQSSWVDRWVDGKIDDVEIHPKTVIKQLELWIKKFYFNANPDVYKVLALWTLGTYFYMLFGSYPYLYINGEKGSGKTVLGKVLAMISFNARAIVDITEASLFRMAAIEGGTIMLDEQEQIGSRKKGFESGFGAILKGGYSSGTAISRFNLDKQANELFDPYCPKIICNIVGMDDIISDRCLEINSYRAKISKDFKLEDPFLYENNPEAYKEITSKCCLCALTYFKDLFDIFNDKENLFEAENARLSQIMSPLLAIARWADMDEVTSKRIAFGLPASSICGEYETAFMNYYRTTIMKNKNEVEANTPEGIIKSIVYNVAMELLMDLPSDEREYTRSDLHKYTEPIKYNKEEGSFEINVLHFKVFMEEIDPGQPAFPRIITRWIKTCFNFDEEDIKRKMVSLENEDLIKEFKGTKKPKVNFYKFYIKDILKSDFLNGKDVQVKKSTDLEF